jgi:hypothetical protein
MWVVLALFHGLLCYWIPTAGFASHVDESGIDTGLWWVSTLSFTLVIHVVTIKLFIESVFWNKMNVAVGLISLLLYYLTIVVLNTAAFSSVFQPQLYYVFFKLLDNGKAWLWIILGPFIAVIPDLSILIYRTNFKPTPVDKVLRIQNTK